MVLTERKKTIIAEIALLLCGVVWGSGFVVMKNALDFLPANWLLTARFFMAGFILLIVLNRKVIHANKSTLIGGVLAGIVMYVAFTAQTIGLSTTTAGNNAFLTAAYVVLVPFFQWIAIKKRPGVKAIVAASVCFAGVGVIAVNEGFRVYAGDAWTLLGGVFFAVHIVIVAHFTSKGANSMPLTCVQFFMSAVCALITALVFEPFPGVDAFLTKDSASSLLYLVSFCTIYAMGAQNVGLRYAPTTHATLLMGTEAPFGFLAGIIFLNEPFTFKFFLGAALIAGSIVYSELGAKE